MRAQKNFRLSVATCALLDNDAFSSFRVGDLRDVVDRLAALERVAEAARQYLLAENADIDAIRALACGDGSEEDQAEARLAADRAAIALGDALDDLDGKQR